MFKKIFTLLIFLSTFLYCTQINDPLHGFSIDIPDDYNINANSKNNKIIIMHQNYDKGISTFVQKNNKSKDDIYLLKILSLPLKKNFYKKIDTNLIIATAKVNYKNISPFFNIFFITGNWIKK